MRPAVDALAALVKPGGWIQLLEADHSGPNEHESPAMWDAFRLIKELFKAMGAGSEYARELGEWLREGGVEGVGERVLDVPLGRKNPKKELAAMGVRSFMSAVAGLVEVARGESCFLFSVFCFLFFVLCWEIDGWAPCALRFLMHHASQYSLCIPSGI